MAAAGDRGPAGGRSSRRRHRPRPPPDGLAELVAGVRCTPPGGRLRVTLKIRKRPGRAKPRVRKVVFFVKRGRARSTAGRRSRAGCGCRSRPGRPAASPSGATFTRNGSRKVRRKTVSRRFAMCD